MNINVSCESDFLQEKALEALSTAVWYHNTLEANGVNLLDEPQYRALLEQLTESRSSQRDQDANARAFHQLQRAIDDETYRQEFPVGTLLLDTWTDVNTGEIYDMPLRIVDYREVKLGNGDTALGAVLLRQHATPVWYQFYQPNQRYPFGYNRYLVSDIDDRLCDGHYSRGCSAILQEVATQVVLKVPALDGTTDQCLRQFFLPDLSELHCDPFGDHPDIDQLAWEYFLDTPTDGDTPCPKRVFCAPDGSAQTCWLRSAHRDAANCEWTVYTDGSADADEACNTYACAPACVVIGFKAQQLSLTT